MLSTFLCEAGLDRARRRPRFAGETSTSPPRASNFTGNVTAIGRLPAQAHGVGELDMFEFFVGYYSICTLPRGDYAIRFIWDLYDPKRTGTVSAATFRKMLRDSMGACLPDYLLRSNDSLPPAVKAQMEKIQQQQGTELWTRLRFGDVCVRTDGNGDRHLAIVRNSDDISITVQDIYTLENPMGWTQGDDNQFT